MEDSGLIKKYVIQGGNEYQKKQSNAYRSIKFIDYVRAS